MTALRKLVPVRIPPPPGFVRPGGDALPAPIPLFGQANVGNATQLMEPRGAGRTNHESQFRRLKPASNPGNEDNLPCLIILSDWSQQPSQELINRIEGIFRRSDEQVLVPTVIIIDDLGIPHADHEVLLGDLTKAGGITLVPHSREEFETICRDPLAFAATQLFAMQSQSIVTTASSPSLPSSPDGYKEFAKPVTRLTPEALRDLIEGKRTDDWRYSM